MSILDGMPSSFEALEKSLRAAAPFASAVLANLRLSPRQQSIIHLMEQGVPLCEILNITQQQRDAIFLQACRQFRAGDIEKARAVLSVLYQLKPTDARVLYMLAATFQVEGQVASAAKLLIYFLALDATNPEGHLRLGECFLAAKEYDNATQSFRTALELCEEGHGSANALEHARRMVAIAAEHDSVAA